MAVSLSTAIAGGYAASGVAGATDTVTLSDGSANTVSLAAYSFPVRVWINAVDGDTVLFEINQGGWSTVGSYTAEAEILVDYTSDETAITDLRFTRSVGSGTTSKIVIR